MYVNYVRRMIIYVMGINLRNNSMPYRPSIPHSPEPVVLATFSLNNAHFLLFGATVRVYEEKWVAQQFFLISKLLSLG